MSYHLTESTRELIEMLEYARPWESDVEHEFVMKYIQPLEGIGYDRLGNGVLRIGTAPILWSCHTDTVHWKPGKQSIGLTNTGLITLLHGARGDCLGADDGAGVWLMCQMARAKVPGLYVFHVGEEHGGKGSQHIADTHGKEWFADIKYAIALDRKGQGDIITHQMVGRCCSDDFAASLGKKLNGLMITKRWKGDDTGTFTDTANYVDLIGECTNISVGYESQHGPGEILDLPFLVRLRDALMVFDCDGLKAVRQPGEKDTEWENQWEEWIRDYSTKGIRKKLVKAVNGNHAPIRGMAMPYGSEINADDVPFYDEAIVEVCRDYPEIAAMLITKLGGNVDDLLELAWREGYDI